MIRVRKYVIANSELRTALEQRFGCPVAEIRRSPSLYSSSAALEEVSVQLTDATKLELVLKDLSPSSALQSADGAKPAFLVDPMREVLVYESILAGRADTAKCYASRVDTAQKVYWVLLEKVPGVELYQVGDVSIWQGVARWLAELHLWGAHLAESSADRAHLLRHMRTNYECWMQRALAHTTGGPRHSVARWLAAKHHVVVEHLVALPRTLIHGEFYASNILVDADSAHSVRVCPVDWEMAALGPGLMDLAALTAGSWSTGQREQIAESYRLAFESTAPGTFPADVFATALDCCRFQMAIQWLGWSECWEPPAQHATDWLEEALQAAARLGL